MQNVVSLAPLWNRTAFTWRLYLAWLVLTAPFVLLVTGWSIGTEEQPDVAVGYACAGRGSDEEQKQFAVECQDATRRNYQSLLEWLRTPPDQRR